MQVVREGYLLLGYSFGITCTLLQSAITEFVCSAKMVKIELCAPAHSSALFSFGILEDVTLRIVKVLACVERCRREENCFRVLPLVLCLCLQFWFYVIYVMAESLHIFTVYLAKLREACVITRSKALYLLWQHSACSIGYVTIGCARVARLVFVLYTFYFLVTLCIKLFAKTLHLLIVLAYLLQSEEAAVLVTVRHHVVLHAACRLRTLLVLHDTVTLVVYYSVPFGF